MPILSADGIDVHFGARHIFNDDSLAIEAKERLGVVGPNGAGKSTLLKILAGRTVPDGGKITRTRGCRVGYLPQEHGEVAQGTLLDALLEATPGRELISVRLEAVRTALESSRDPEDQLSLSQQLADLTADLSSLEQDYGVHRAEKILSGLGFTTVEFRRPVAELSGGWRMRAALATLLYERPDVLLLDEPTNHLDVPSVRWLDGFLRAFPKALVITCHDREFLNRHIRRVASIEPEGLRVYDGDYDAYLAQRAVEREYLEARAKKDEQRRKELEAFVTRFRAKASKARQAQSKAKLIEKMQEDVVELPEIRRTVSIRFPPSERSGDPVVRIEGVRFAYGTTPLFSKLDLTIRRGDRIAIIGMNGAGKTTLLRLIAGELQPSHGQIGYGRNVVRSYFAQHHAAALDPRRSVLEEVWQANRALSQTAVRSLAGAFLFSGGDVEKPVGVLSGGEKARVALAKLLAAPGNFLLLDEPTNHLDTESADRLTESLASFDGTLLFVSHSLHFATQLSNQVWDVAKGEVVTYPGSLGEYLDRLRPETELGEDGQGHSADQANRADRSVRSERSERTNSADKVGPSLSSERKAARIEAREAEKRRLAETRRTRTALEKRVHSIEGEIVALEEAQARVEQEMSDPSCHADASRMRALVLRYEEGKARLASLLEAWEKAHVDLCATSD